MSYATIEDVKVRYNGDASDDLIDSLLIESAIIIDSYNENALPENKKHVSVRMVVRALGSDYDVPVGASQGTVSALGYSQTWTMSGGSSGELYISKTEKKMLGCGEKIGSHSPLEDLS